MSDILTVIYTVEVHADVDLDSGRVVGVTEQLDTIEPAGIVVDPSGSQVTEEWANKAQAIAEGDDDWPAWDRG